MNSIDFNNPIFKNSVDYNTFIKDNSSVGYLSIRAYAANKAIPIKGLKVEVSKNFDNNKIIFFEGLTDESGVIQKISLPAPSIDSNDELVPKSINYNIEATYNNQKLLYTVIIYSNITVNQNINVVPNIKLDGNLYVN